MDVKTITKEQFDAAYNSYPANTWTKFAFKYFSKSTEKKNLILSSTVAFLLGGLFVVGFGATVLNLSTKLILTVTLIYLGILIALAVLMFGTMIMNNIRIKKISNLLGISVDDYNNLVDKFYS
jgi:hypothetical protein